MNNKQFLYGFHAVNALLQKQPERILRLCIQQEKRDHKLEELIRLAKKNGLPIEHVSKKLLDQTTENANHQGVLVFCKPAPLLGEQDLATLLNQIKNPFLLILDGVQDPHNLGACFRSADAAGVHAIIAPKDKAVGITPIVSKVASGAAETIPFVQVTNLARALELLKEKGVWIYGAAAEEGSQNLFKTDLTGPVALVMGAEGEGLRRLTREHCDVLISIPMQGTVESLNVSVAAGICLFEVVRQRLVKNR